MRKILFAVCFVIAGTAHAVTIEQPLASAAKEARARAIFSELRCVVCEGQALAESDAQLAHDMRSEIRDMIMDGKSDTEILEYFVARYGEHVLLNPPLEISTLLLWATPLLLLVGGLVMLSRSVRGK